LYHGIVDLVPSSSTRLRDTIEESDLNKIIDLTNNIASTGRVAQDPDGVTYQDVKIFVADIFGPAVSS
jgi:hypothetical protein